MIYGGLPAVIMYFGLLLHALINILKKKDRYATVLYATVGVLLLMSLMEVYSITLISFIIVLTYYYGQSSSSLIKSDESENENHS